MEDVTLVHNGIIENSDELKVQLINMGFVFNTQTDTEVAAAVLSSLLRDEKDKIKVMHRANDILRGSYAFGIIFRDEPETVYCIKKDAPLILGEGKDIIYLASDVSAFLPYTNMVVDLADGEIARLQDGTLTLFDEDCNIIERSSEKTTLTLQDIRKGRI